MTLTIELPAEQEAALAARAHVRGVSIEEYVRQVLAQDAESGLPPQRHIWDVIAETMKDVPAEDLAALPKDGLSQIDHYVYGVAKRDAAVEKWLREDVVGVCDAMLAEPGRAIAGEQVFSAIRARHADRLTKKQPAPQA